MLPLPRLNKLLLNRYRAYPNFKIVLKYLFINYNDVICNLLHLKTQKIKENIKTKGLYTDEGAFTSLFLAIYIYVQNEIFLLITFQQPRLYAMVV
jgi:hypothetical protein